MPIETLQDLRDHVELAIRVELSTIPPYLYSMYSIEDPKSEASLLIRSIVAEEMLHAVLASNLLLALGGKPKFGDASYLPTYPLDMPHHRPPLTIDLAPCSEQLIRDLFMRIEQPETHNAPPQPDEYETLGQFYHALELAVEVLSEEVDLFESPQTDAQLADPSFYAPIEFDAEDSGGLVLISSKESALAALEVIVHQGEGLSDDKWADPAHQELTHYHKLVQIVEGSSPLGATRPLRRNPKTSGYPIEIQPVSDLFNAVYRGVYLVMDRMFTPGGNQSRAVGVLYLLMADVLSQVGHFLAGFPLEDGSHAGPTFEVFEHQPDQLLAQAIYLAKTSSSTFPELTPAYEALHALEFII